MKQGIDGSVGTDPLSPKNLGLQIRSDSASLNKLFRTSYN